MATFYSGDRAGVMRENEGTMICNKHSRCRAQRWEIEALIKSSFEMGRVMFYHSFEGGNRNDEHSYTFPIEDEGNE